MSAVVGMLICAAVQIPLVRRMKEPEREFHGSLTLVSLYFALLVIAMLAVFQA